MPIAPLLTKALSADLRAVVPITPMPTYVNHKVLGAGAETETVPAGASVVVIATTADLWVTIGGTAATPVADVTDGTGVFLLAAGSTRSFAVGPAAAISVIAQAGAGIVSFEYYGSR